MFRNILKRIYTVLKLKKNHPILSVLIVGISALLCAPLSQTENYHLVSYLLLFVVSMLATFMGIIPVVIASSLSALIWNYFFIPPHFTFHIDRAEDILLFAMFFIIAMLNGVLTNRLRHQAELAEKARFLDESARLYKTLFNSISHELRIPVATIMGASESLITSEHPANVQSVLTREIFTASERLNRVIENLLNMSRLESGRLSARFDWHDINDLVNKVLEDLKDELKNFVVVAEIPEDMPLVRIDFGLMEQVLYNLLFNSGEHANAGSEIKLNIKHVNDNLIIQLIDHGPGFPPDKIDNVFDKFFKVESGKAGGLGLGLSIVKGFVEAHKGNITVENLISGGAVFTIMIPSEEPEIKLEKV